MSNVISLDNNRETSKIFSDLSNDGLADLICEKLNVAKGRLDMRRFSCSEISVGNKESIQRKNVSVVQSKVYVDMSMTCSLNQCSKMEGEK